MPIRSPIRSWLFLAALLVAVPASRLDAQGTAPVPASDLAYRDIDRLAELGVLDSVILAQRPFSRREMARVARLARARLDRPDFHASRRAAEANKLVERLLSRFARDDAAAAFNGPRIDLMDGAQLAAVSTNAVRRGFSGTFSDRLEATIDPLAAPRRLGVPAPRGQSAAVELAQRMEATSWLALYARERVEALLSRQPSGDRARDALLRAGMRLRVGNVTVNVGREQLAWAASADDGLFLAADAPALDQISLAGDHPFVLPGFLRVVGPTQATLVFADLGPSMARSHSMLLAYKVSVQPRPTLELGATFMNHFGGRGAPAASLGNRVIDFLPFVDIFRSHNYTDSTRTLDVESDKLLGVSGRWRIERLAGLTLATELLIDDFDVHRIPTLFGWDGSQTFAATLPSVARSPLALQLSVTHMGVRTYTHGQLSNGITTRGQLLGDELGPDAKAFGTALTWHASGDLRFGVDARTALYSKSDYHVVQEGDRFTNHRVGKVTNELRDRLVASLELQRANGMALVARAGAERIRNADFVDAQRHSFVLDVALRFAR